MPRPQFIEEHGLIKMMINHGLPVEMTAEEFETGNWQRSILEADRQATEEKEGRRLFMESCEASEVEQDDDETSVVVPAQSSTLLSLAESVNKGELAQPEPLVNAMSDSRRRSRRSSSVTSLSAFRSKGAKMARLTPPTEDAPLEDDQQHSLKHCSAQKSSTTVHTPPATEDEASEAAELEKAYVPYVWFERRIPHNGGEVCARLVEEFMAKLVDGMQDD